MKREDIYIRDPYIILSEDEKLYYMFGTTDKNCWGDVDGTGFNYYTSKDLENFEGPFIAFRPEKDFWGSQNFWAPEVHLYNNKYYMFATFISPNKKRGTLILVSDKLSSPFKPLTNKPITPEDWMCLDGTLYVDDEGNPWCCFCHEWVEIGDGNISLIKLSKDLKNVISKPVTLFNASDAKWSSPFDNNKRNDKCYVTDGPFIYTCQDKTLLMMWSSFTKDRSYAIGVSKSESGKITGPWVPYEKALFEKDGGHGMIFKTLENKLMLTFHSPNTRLMERPYFFEIEEIEKNLKLK